MNRLYSKETFEIDKMPEQTNSANRYLKVLWLIPVLAIGYISWMNLLPLGGISTYSIDVGGQDTEGDVRVTGPFDRISDKKEVDGISFRELEKNLVYFELYDRRLDSADEIEVRIKFEDNFPMDGNLILGAKNNEEWSYYWKDIYIPFYRRLADLPAVAENGNIKVYFTGEQSEAKFPSVGDFLQNPPLGSVIATNDKVLSINQRISPEGLENIDFDKVNVDNTTPIQPVNETDKYSSFETDTSLRGTHTFYFFSSGGTLELTIAKRDINRYEGEDMLEVLIYSLDGTLKARGTIPDDGDITKDKKLRATQYSTLRLDNLERGTYRLMLNPISEGDDFVITHLRLNQAKLVVPGRVFLAGNVYLGGDLRPMAVWCYLSSEGEIKFKTSHKSAFQTVSISGETCNQTLDIDTTGEWSATETLDPGIYQITAEKGDVIIAAPNSYITFTRDSLFLPTSSLNLQESDSLSINTILRGGHTFWTYISNGVLELKITKQDLNWYENPDELAIEVYSSDNELKGSSTIPDDGDEGKGKEMGTLQSGFLRIEDLQPGTYRIELKCSGDILIRQIEINQEKLVTNTIFPAGMNPAYFKNSLAPDPLRLYGKNFSTGQITFNTSHSSGLQQIFIQGNDFDTAVDINEVKTDFSTSLKDGIYQLTAPRQDLLIKSSGYFSFTPDSFFLPRRCEVVDLKYDMSWVNEKSDYVVVDYDNYVLPVEHDSWLIAQATWKREDLFIDNDKLGFCFNVPHLEKETDRAIPIDWIEITLKMPPIWERLGWTN
jgi:hypothetical protein